ncbi:InlB B-repeat-containing protein [Bacteroides congonensis]|uniref:InlB B-repeat-containing protein n=1 Tax=Bacteroides congonensis TaxID=1871006 RepID=UPI0026760C8E|nr:leucine-rich repeat domain-containing protein [Bacteroides congonensis]
MKQNEFVGNIESFSNKFINQQKLKNMKRLSFLLMAVVCVIFFSCGEDEDKQVHSITAFASYGGATATADKEIAAAGETVTVTATPVDGFLFKEWKVRVGNTIVDNVQANPSTFTMPVEDVVIVATFMIRNDVLERITDPALKAYCQSRMDTEQEIDGITYPKWDTNGNGVLSPDEASAVKAIDITGGHNGMKIRALDGLNEFTGIELLNLSGNDLPLLTTIWPKLTKLDCSYNQLEGLAINKSMYLNKLYCHNNHLASLSVESMDFENEYMLHCGRQTSIDGQSQMLELTLDDGQKELWEGQLKNLIENSNVILKDKPKADVYMLMEEVSVAFNNGVMTLTLKNAAGDKVDLKFSATSDELSVGTYSEFASNSSVNIHGSGSVRRLDMNKSNSFIVRYSENTQIYTIEGLLSLKTTFSDARSIVSFEYRGKI